MEFSWRYTDSLNRIFSSYEEANIDDTARNVVSLDQHNVFDRMFVVDVSSDEIEVPMFAKAVIEDVVVQNMSRGTSFQKVVIPLYVNSYNQTRRTADSIINEFSRVSFNNRLQKVTTNKGEVYYGGRGIILDGNFKPLILCSVLCKKEEFRSNEYMDYYKPIIRVNPEVFLNETGLINKTILKKIIPFYLTHTIPEIHTRTRFRDKLPEDRKPQILIEDSSRFIETPAIPNPNTCSNEALNKLLLDNIEDVISQIQ